MNIMNWIRVHLEIIRLNMLQTRIILPVYSSLKSILSVIISAVLTMTRTGVHCIQSGYLFIAFNTSAKDFFFQKES